MFSVLENPARVGSLPGANIDGSIVTYISNRTQAVLDNMRARAQTVYKDPISTGDGDNKCENQEDEWSAETDTLAPDVSTILRAFFYTTQDCCTYIAPIVIRVDIEQMTGKENSFGKDGCSTAIRGQL